MSDPGRRRSCAGRTGRVRLAPVLLLNLVLAGAAWGESAADAPGPASPPGVAYPQRAWQNWTLNCQGCHRPDGTGSAATAPRLKDTVSRFLGVPGGREYLGRVPGVATSPLADADLAELMNWMFWRFDRGHLPVDFRPFTAEEIGRLRRQPLRLEAARMRTDLLRMSEAELGTRGAP